ncbi:SDR family NAD(P)-dependent oxidoreductase [Pasteurellaceae bacterium LIM206]|nr:SDR family NAD(P)-dependent oxidoreductase [Pasteurellaceae bacterium LIM206]
MIKTIDLSLPDNARKLYADLTEYELETWINNAGMGNYATVAEQNLDKIEKMLRLNVEAVTILSSLFTADYQNVEGTQLINISSRGGYVIVPAAVTYCATKFYVGAFTEGLAWELKQNNAAMQAKVLAPAATQTEFGKIANDVSEYDYNRAFLKYHTAKQMSEFLLQLYHSDKTVGLVDWETFTFTLRDPIFNYAGISQHNQQIN